MSKLSLNWEVWGMLSVSFVWAHNTLDSECVLFFDAFHLFEQKTFASSINPQEGIPDRGIFYSVIFIPYIWASFIIFFIIFSGL